MSERARAVADDVRREVRLRRISWEADEQSGAIRCGVRWNEGWRPRGIRVSKACTGPRTGKALDRIRQVARYR